MKPRGPWLIAILFLATACNGGSSKTPVGTDSGGAGAGGAGSEGDAGSGTGLRAVIVTEVSRPCPGCVEVSACGSLPTSDGTRLSIVPRPNNGVDAISDKERLGRAGRALPLGTCKVLANDELETISNPFASAPILKAGDIRFESPMSLTPEPIELAYVDESRNYSDFVVFASETRQYEPGVEMHLSAPGGPDVSAFSITAQAPEPLELLSPAVNGAGQIENIDRDSDLELKWEGASEVEDVVITILSSYCDIGPESGIVCHAANSGAFTIAQEILSEIDWSNLLSLGIEASSLVPIAAPELEDAAWRVGARASVPIFYDESVAAPAQTCESTSMEEGFVGAACSDDSSCGGGCCLKAIGDYFADNYCTLLGCSSDDQCPADALCAPQTRSALPVQDYCAKRCSSDSDCRTPAYICAPVSDGAKACVLGVM